MASLFLTKLANRKIIRISGPDCYSYLQGLLCNDLTYLYEPDKVPARRYARQTSSVMSSFMLNAQGRAICDMLLYRTPSTRYECKFTPPGKATEHDELLLECDSSLASGLANTLYGYRVRRKISIAIEDNITVWSLFPNLMNSSDVSSLPISLELVPKELVERVDVINEDLTVVNDPRLTSLGLRIIAREGNFDSIKKSLHSFIDCNIEETKQRNYILYRYELGVGEGILDHPESNCFPLECNADHLGSVSFTKGCYLGQELTARIHFTGVVRKRLMPLLIEDALNTTTGESLPLVDGSDIVEEDTGKKIGILRHVTKNRALALLRTDLVDKLNEKGAVMIHEGSKKKVSTCRPYWWN